MAIDKYDGESTWAFKGQLGEILMAHYLRDKKKRKVLYHQNNKEKQYVGIDIETTGFLHPGTECFDVKMNDKINDGKLEDYWGIFIRRNKNQIRQPFRPSAQTNWVSVVTIDYKKMINDDPNYMKTLEGKGLTKEEEKKAENETIKNICNSLMEDYSKKEKKAFNLMFKKYVHSIIYYPADYLQRYGRRLLNGADSIDEGAVRRKTIWFPNKSCAEVMEVNWKLSKKQQREMYLNPKYQKKFHKKIGAKDEHNALVAPLSTLVYTNKKKESYTIEQLVKDPKHYSWVMGETIKKPKCAWRNLKESLEYWHNKFNNSDE